MSVADFCSPSDIKRDQVPTEGQLMATLAQVMTTPQPSRLTISGAPAGRSLSAVGTIDSHTAQDLLDQINELGTEADATLDLGEVDFIDSSGLRTIVTCHQQFEEADARLVLKDPSESVKRLLEITGLLDHLHIS